MSEQHPLYGSDFIIESVLFESPRLQEPVELKDTVSDIEIIEDIQSPFLIAKLSLRDDQKFLTGVDISGAETIIIKIKSNRINTKPISKRFYIKKIILTTKINDVTEAHTLDLVEDVMYEANLQNVNRSYTGKYHDIITKISNNFLNKNVYSTNNDVQTVKVIVPNLNPVQAMLWLKNKASTVEGYPFFLFSTFVTDSLKFVDLGTMLSNTVINEKEPYRYFTSAIQSENPDVQRKVIYAMEQKNTDDLYDLIKEGAVGTKYTYIDTVKNNQNNFQFDVTKDLLNPLIAKTLPGNQKNVMYGTKYEYNGKPYNTLASNTFTRIGGSSPFKTFDTEILPYGERLSVAEYKQEVISNAMERFLTKAPMTMVISGVDFIDGDVHHTIGNNIRVHVLNSTNPENEPSEPLIDKKKSGDYLIFAAHHMFKRGIRYDLKLSCVKMANYT